MADLVRSTVEAMVPDLLGLMKRKIFTKKEVKEILKTREEFEYTFLRRTSTKKDYLKAIQYEYELENKRRERFNTLKLKKQTQRDFTIIRRIIFIFDRLTAKYKYNVDLWKEYCLFCYKIRANRMFFKAVSNALTVNWESLEIWLLAIYYHFDINRDPFKARKTFLKGLKMNNKRKDFWLEYFRFELNFLQNIKQRKQISGVEKEEKVEMDQEDDQNDEIQMFDEEDSKPVKKESMLKTEGFSNDDFVGFEEDGTAKSGLKSDEADSLAIVVYESVIEVFPNDKTINGELLQICNEFQGEWIDKIKGDILTVLKEKYIDSPLANLHAFMEMYSLNQKAFENDTDETIFEKLNSVIKEMIHYFKALSDRYEQEEETAGNLIKDKSILVQAFVNQIASHYKHMTQISNPRSKLFEASFSVILKNINLNDLDTVTVQEIFIDIFQFTSTIGTISEEKAILIHHISSVKNIDYKILEQLGEIAVKFSGQKIVDSEELALRIRKYIKAHKASIPAQNQASLFSLLFRLERIAEDKNKIIEFLKESIKYLCFNQGFAEFLQICLKEVMAVYPVTEIIVSQCFVTLFNLRSSCPVAVSLLYVDKLSEIKATNPEIKKHLQKALDWHPQSIELWLRYIGWEKTYGNPLLCPDLFQKAQRQIKDGSFLHEYTTLMSS